MSKKVLIAESSKLVKIFLAKVLKEAGFETLEVTNGLEAILEIKKSSPDCILCSTILPVLTGFEVSKIIKCRETLNIPVALYSIAEENYSDSFGQSSLCDDFFLLDTKDPQILVDKIENLTKKSKKSVQQNNTNKTSVAIPLSDSGIDTQLISALNEVTGFYQKESEQLNIISALYSIFANTTSPKNAAFTVLDVLQAYVPYDIASITILMNDIPYDFCRLKMSISQQEIQDFLEIAHDNFKYYDNGDSQLRFDHILFNVDGSLPEYSANQNIKIKSSETAILFGDDFIGTLMVGSTKSEYALERYSDKFQFFAEKLSPFLVTVLDQYILGQNIQKLRKAFSSFVPEEIIDDLIDRADVETETTGEKRRVCVLICDIRNFTTISEHNKAEDVVSFLNNYFTQMVEIIKSNGGSIDKFMGDAIMALFGAPMSYEDNAQRAVEAAIQMINILPNIDTSRLILPEGYGQIDIGIGLHYGEVILGSIGCEDKKDYTVIGDSVNLASRLEGLTKLYGNHIVISDSVKKELNKSIDVHKLDKVAVKGKKIPVWIHSVKTDADNFTEKYYNNYEKGIELYEVGAWALAQGYFEKALKEKSNDKAASIMINRCQEYIINPPENWDGTVALTSK